MFDEEMPYEIHFDSTNLLDIKEYDNSLVLDLFDSLAYIFYKDFYTQRDEDANRIRQVKLKIPVNNYDAFNKLKINFFNLIKYMTNGEEWEIEFVPYTRRKKIDNNQLADNMYKINSIALLSGGLDALAGTFMEQNNNTLFITFANSLIETNKANILYKDLVKRDNNLHVNIKKIDIDSPKHYTERTRTLMFLACTLIYADHYKVNQVKIYENGIMSLNPKFNFSRKVTKTTHPKTLYLLNEILKDLGINLEFINPFSFKTKGEILKILPQDYKNFIINTRTCSKNLRTPHFINRVNEIHCGICIACILRQISINSTELNNYDCKYLLPPNMVLLKSIASYENEISKNKENNVDKKAAIYKFNEKKSLINYYKLYKQKIDDKTIYNYLDLKDEYFTDKEWLSKIDNMLKTFSREIDLYMKGLEK